ncbi:MAG: M15 family metallopeptidase [Bacillota bacterium]
MLKILMLKNYRVILAAAAFLVIATLLSILIFIYEPPIQGNIENPDDTLVLVNKANYLSSDYVPGDLIIPEVKCIKGIAADEKKMREKAAKALEELFASASKEGMQLYCESGYRSFATQKKLYEWVKREKGEEYANKYCALPGRSEHQTGLAMDITNIDHYDEENDKALGRMKEGLWLKNNAHRFGFILRYPEGRTNITGYNYEPWHFRYVGIEAATEIYNKGIVLEEYFEKSTQ